MTGSQSKYKLISADGHLNGRGTCGPPGWPRRIGTGCPRVERLAEGDGWVCEGFDTTLVSAGSATAGRKPEEHGRVVSLRGHQSGRLRPEGPGRGAASPTGSTPNCSSGRALPADYVAGHQGRRPPPRDGPGLQRLPVRVLRHAPDRLVGAAMIPNRGVDQAASRRSSGARTCPASCALLLQRYPNGDHVDRARGRRRCGKRSRRPVSRSRSTSG